MKSGLLSGIGKSFTDAADIAKWYYGEKKEDDRYKEQKGLLAQEKEDKEKKYQQEIIGYTKTGTPVTRGMLSGKEYDGPLYDKMSRATGSGDLYVDENGNRVDPATHKGQIFKVGSYGAKGSSDTALEDNAKLNKAIQSVLGEDAAVGKPISGKPPDEATQAELRRQTGKNLVFEYDDGGFWGGDSYRIVTEATPAGPGAGKGGEDVDVTVGDDAPGLDMSKVKKKTGDAQEAPPASNTPSHEQKKAVFMEKHRTGASPALQLKKTVFDPLSQWTNKTMRSGRGVEPPATSGNFTRG